MKPKPSRQEEITKTRAKINETETNKTVQRISESMSWFFEKINKIDTPLAQLIKRKKGQGQINKIRDERGNITTDNEKIQTIIQEYFKNLYSIKFENLRKMDEFFKSWK